MKPVDQIVFEDNKGDCFRACVASILELPLEEVPNFTEWSDMYKAAEEWFSTKGFKLYSLHVKDHVLLDDIFFMCSDYCILGGKSPRLTQGGSVKYHSVVARAHGWGLEIVHDPHPSRAGLEPSYRWVRFIVKA
jgi:hypothetical protein